MQTKGLDAVLKGIPQILTPELLRTLSAMGHGDEIVLADANFPAYTYEQYTEVLHAGPVGIPALLRAVLRFFPMDTYVPQPAALMAVAAGDDFVPVIWEEYKALFAAAGIADRQIERVERFRFYERAQNAFAVVTTGEMSKYGNIILKKGVIAPGDMPD